MKRAVTALALLLVLSVRCWSQSQCVDSGATPVDTVSADVALSGNSAIIWEYGIFRTSSGQIQYVINVASIHFTGDGGVVDGMTTKQIFDLISQASVAQGVALGHTACSTSCSAPSYAVVRIPACVKRLGTGTDTFFEVCAGSGCCVRVYSVCCPAGGGGPNINLVSSTSPGCVNCTGCDSTCP